MQMISPSHLQARVQPMNTYNHTYKKTPDPSEYMSNLDLKINTALPMATHPNVLGLTLDPKLTCNTYIHNISVQAHKPLQMMKALTATGWDKQKETLMATYKAVMRPALEYASSIWSPLASSTSINKLQAMQNATLRTATGCTQDTNIQHLHDETRAPTDHTNTKSTPNHIHQHYAPFVTLTYTTHIIASTALTYEPRCLPCICWPDRWRSCLVAHKQIGCVNWSFYIADKPRSTEPVKGFAMLMIYPCGLQEQDSGRGG